MNRKNDWRPWLIVAMLLSISLVIAYQYVQHIEIPTVEARRQLQQSILDGNAESPYRYRVLVPYLTHGLEATVKLIKPGDTFKLAYAIYDTLAIFASLTALFYYLRNWFSQSASLIGALIAAVSMLVGFRDHYYQPWSLLEPATIALGLHLIYHKKIGWLAGLIAISTLNRETGIFLAAAYFFPWVLPNPFKTIRKEKWKDWLVGLALLLIWALIFWGLRLVLGEAPHIITVKESLGISIQPQNLLLALRQWILFLGIFWLFIPLGFKAAPSFARKMAWLIPAYLVVIMFYAIWFEVRLLMPLYPVLIPIGLAYLFPSETV